MAPWAPASDLPGTEQAALTNLALPMGPTLGRETAAAVADALAAVRR
jgi:dTDP-4-amino-4,6-dideoxygalactose transaminase